MSRKSIYFNDKSENFVKNRTVDDANYSAYVNFSFEVIEHLSKSEKPLLSDEDWVEIFNVYAGSDLTRYALPFNLAKDLLDHYGATLPRDLPDNCVKLVERLADMTQAEQFSVFDNVRVFWANVD